MKVQVKLFARARDIVGVDCVELELPEQPQVADLRTALTRQFPDMESLVPNLLVAVGQDYADETTAISKESEVACFPPVSGG